MAEQSNQTLSNNTSREAGTWRIQTLDEADRLAIYIVGAFALSYPDISAAIAELDSQQTNHVWEDVASAIREALPHLDMTELSRLHRGTT